MFPPARGQTVFVGSRDVALQPVCDDGEVAVRCLIVDDSGRFLEAARMLLEREGIRVVGVASTSDEALERAESLRPDVTLVDIDLGAESGFRLARRLEGLADVVRPRVILISTHAEEDFADLIAASPVCGFLPKSSLSARAILDLLGGGSTMAAG
jgi:DNA-binding NarL/FixJ family response regulator